MLVDSGMRCWAQGFRVQGADSDVLTRCLWLTTAFLIFVFRDLRLEFWVQGSETSALPRFHDALEGL